MSMHAVNAELEIASIVQENHRQAQRSLQIAEATSSLAPARVHITLFRRVHDLTRTFLAGVGLASGSPGRAERQVGCRKPRSASFAD